nr:hypothetical protein [Tanacetum cinerariifolium]
MPLKKTTTPVSEADINRLIAQGVVDALAKYEATKNNRNGDNSHDSGTDGRRKIPTALFDISNCTDKNQVKYATCTLLGNALTWWNSHVKTVGHDPAYDMPWKTRMKMMTNKYCSRGEIKKLEIEIWNLKVKGTDVVSYTQRFQELALLCRRMFLEVSDEVEKYVGGLPDMIQGSVMAFKPKTMQEAIEIANDPMDQKCAPKCNKCKKVGHLAHDCRSPDTNVNNQRAPEAIQKVVTCFECGIQGHYKKDRQKQRITTVEIKLEIVEHKQGLISNRSFMSTAFSFLIDIIPTILDHDYDVELANGRIIRVNTIIRGFTLHFLSHPFNIDLMPVEIGSFDVIIGMDWLLKYHDVIVCAEKIVRIPFGNEILIVRGDESNNRQESRLNIISCTKSQKYLLKGCPIFLAHITAKKTEDKSEEQRLEDVPIVRDFPEVFLEDLSAIPPT